MLFQFNRALWLRTSYPERHNPPWPCPDCWESTLHPKEDLIIAIKDEEIAVDMSHPFVEILSCNNCNEQVVMSGRMEFEDETIDTPFGPEYATVQMFYPKYFYPNLKVFPLEEYYPGIIRKSLNNAFALFLPIYMLPQIRYVLPLKI